MPAAFTTPDHLRTSAAMKPREFLRRAWLRLHFKTARGSPSSPAEARASLMTALSRLMIAGRRAGRRQHAVPKRHNEIRIVHFPSWSEDRAGRACGWPGDRQRLEFARTCGKRLAGASMIRCVCPASRSVIAGAAPLIRDVDDFGGRHGLEQSPATCGGVPEAGAIVELAWIGPGIADELLHAARRH